MADNKVAEEEYLGFGFPEGETAEEQQEEDVKGIFGKDFLNFDLGFW